MTTRMEVVVQTNHLPAMKRKAGLPEGINQELIIVADAYQIRLKSALQAYSKRLSRQIEQTQPTSGIDHQEVHVEVGDRKRFWAHFMEYGTVKAAANPILEPEADKIFDYFEQRMIQYAIEVSEAAGNV